MRFNIHNARLVIIVEETKEAGYLRLLITSLVSSSISYIISDWSDLIDTLQIYHVWEGYLRKIPVERRNISRAEWRRKFSLKTGILPLTI